MIRSILRLMMLACVTGMFAEAPAQNLMWQQRHVVIAWNDLGMHCMNSDFEWLCLLPPANTLQAQVIERGNPPRLVGSGVEVGYAFVSNTTSANKVNFWTHAQKLFGLSAPLPVDMGLAGFGMSGKMIFRDGAWIAQWIPLTPYTDAEPTVLRPYQLAMVTLSGAHGERLDQTMTIAPVSTEMRCDKCHSGGRRTVWENILRKHDDENDTNLVGQKPVLCAGCHADAALGAPGKAGLPSMSEAMHEAHSENEVSGIGCYDCHPGEQTQCLRGAMHVAGKTCQDCHGTIRQVAESIEEHGRKPWIDEPACASCHPMHGENPGKLFRESRGHGGVMCCACHGSPHAELASSLDLDGVQAVRLQGRAEVLSDCMVCHTVRPQGAGPHGLRMAESAVPRDSWMSMQ